MNWKDATSLKIFLRLISIVFLFLVRLRFPSHLSTVQVICNRYGNEVVNLMRKFERLDFRYRIVLLDLDFLDNCIRNDVVSKFVQFRVTNKDFAIRQFIDRAKQNYLNKKFPTRRDVQDCLRRIYYLQEMTLCVNWSRLILITCVIYFYYAMIKLFENSKNSRIKSSVSCLKFHVKVSRMTQKKLSVTFPVIN